MLASGQHAPPKFTITNSQLPKFLHQMTYNPQRISLIPLFQTLFVNILWIQFFIFILQRFYYMSSISCKKIAFSYKKL